MSDIIKLIPKDSISAKCIKCGKMGRLMQAIVTPLRTMMFHVEQTVYCDHCKRRSHNFRKIHEQTFNNWKKHVYNVVPIQPPKKDVEDVSENIQETFL